MRRTRIFHTENFRLAALFAVLFASSAALLIAAVYWIAESALTAELLDAVNADIGAISDGYRSQGIPEAIEIVHQRTATPGFSDYYLLQDKSGAKLAGNLDAMPVRLGLANIPPPRNAKFRHPEEHVILGKGVMLPNGAYMFAGEDTHQLGEAREGIFRAFAWITGATVLLAFGVGLVFGKAFIRRIDMMTQTCRAIVAGQFDNRIPIRGSKDELDFLASTINGMLDRIATLMESLRQVSSDIAHDLRTPLTHLQQRLEMARAQASTVEDYAGAVDRAIGDADEILAIFSALLRISQIESGSRQASFAPVDMADLLRQVSDIYGPVAEDSGQKLETQLTPEVTVDGDRALLLQMFANLIENAIRHTPKGTRIGIALGLDDGEAVVRVTDSGRGIPPAERDKVFHRFHRLEASRGTPGNGLGLALVAAIARLHHASIALSDNRPGLCVTLRLPVRGTPMPRRELQAVETASS